MYKNYTIKWVHVPRERTSQILRIMKLVILILFTALMQVSAATYGQRLTIKDNTITLKQLFSEINKQTGYNVIWSAGKVNGDRVVRANFNDTPLQEALNKAFAGQRLTYVIDGKTVIIQQQEIVFDRIKEKLPKVTIGGTVRDETGKALVGVTVRENGTGNVASTDMAGSFLLTVTDNNSTISFSYVGYEAEEFQAKDLVVNAIIVMKPSPINLKEVVVNKGYYHTTQELNTGDVTLVSGNDIQKSPVTDPILALEGRVAGMQISQSSGIPGAYSKIQIRGQNSIANGNDPLYVIDGVPYTSISLSSVDLQSAVGQGGGISNSANNYALNGGGLSPFNMLNPADIENIEILKDADATAIYGSRGANGVILITTRKGKAGDTKVNAGVSHGAGRVTRKLELLNTSQYLQMRHQALANDGLTPGQTDYDINGAWDTTRTTDWQKVFIGGTSHYTNVNTSVSGGNINTQFLVAGNYSRQSTVFPGEFNDQKGGVNFSLTHSSNNQKFHSTLSAQYINDVNEIPLVDFTNFIQLAPDAPPLYGPDGKINFQNNTFTDNPIVQTLRTSTSNSNNLVGNLNLAYDILPGLQIKGNFGYTRMGMEQNNITPSAAFAPPNDTYSYNREHDKAINSVTTWIIEPQLSYSRGISNGKLNVLLGITRQQTQQKSFEVIAYDFTSDQLLGSMAAAASSYIAGDYLTDYHYEAIYGRLGYNWEDKYLINFTARRDGSSRFGPGKQFGNFGAAGVAWIFSKEQMIANALPFLSFGKLRASYGLTGNDQITPYQYLSLYKSYSASTYQGVNTLYPTQIVNPYFAWETVKKLEGGLELGFLQDKIFLTVSYYRNRTGNQLVGEPLPITAGFSFIQANLPAVVQNTGLEMTLNTVNLKTQGFTWRTGLNLTVPRNKLVSFPGLSSNNNYNSLYSVGKSLLSRPVLQYTGVNPQTGLYTFQDLNHDGIINYLDRSFSKQIGQYYYGGFQNTFTYKNWQMDVLVQFVKQDGANYLNSFPRPGQEEYNQPVEVINNAWKKPGDNASMEQFSTIYNSPAGIAYNNYVTSNARYSDASFIRLKNVSLSYVLPASWQRSLHMQNAKLFFQGQNLFTFTNYLGLDPETQGLSLPPLRMLSMGFSATF